ncbi:olfactory receptor 10J1-like [Alosa pseudoharengus]|uniref:olfactory receptor 10J1-like n=1 Tax=Alosa pseudoharengus TaxID=34774 RepID=UPI003F895A0D
MANISIMCLIYFDTALHKPMYMFLFSLLLNGLIGSTAVWPKVMVILLTGDNTNSVEGCLIQAFFMITYGACNFTILAVMAYDRLLSIFNPLQYYTIMTPRKIKQLLFAANVLPAVFILGHLCVISMIPLCKNKINRLFCDTLSFHALSCVEAIQRRVSNLYGICVFVCFGVVPILLIFLSYLKIILLSLKISRNARKKAFETCTPHLIIFINFSFVSIFFVIYVRFYPNFQHLFLSVSYNLFPPLLHPLVYGIRNKETRQSFSKIRRKVIFALGLQETEASKVDIPPPELLEQLIRHIPSTAKLKEGFSTLMFEDLICILSYFLGLNQVFGHIWWSKCGT